MGIDPGIEREMLIEILISLLNVLLCLHLHHLQVLLFEGFVLGPRDKYRDSFVRNQAAARTVDRP